MFKIMALATVFAFALTAYAETFTLVTTMHHGDSRSYCAPDFATAIAKS